MTMLYPKDRPKESYPWRRPDDEDDQLLHRVEWFDVEQMVRALERDTAETIVDREIPGRLLLCQEWMQRYAAHHAMNDTRSIRSYVMDWEERCQRVSREYSAFIISHPPPKSRNETVDWLQKIFGSRHSPPPTTLPSAPAEFEPTNDVRTDETSIPSTLPSEAAWSDTRKNRRPVAPPWSFTPPLSHSNHTGMEELQAAQKEQMEAAVAEMAQQMKDRTRHLHEQLRQQNQQLLQNLETTLLDNQEQLTQVTVQTQAHVRKQWYRTVSHWTMLLILLAAFVATIFLILVIPKPPVYRDGRYGKENTAGRNDRPAAECKIDATLDEGTPVGMAVPPPVAAADASRKHTETAEQVATRRRPAADTGHATTPAMDETAEELRRDATADTTPPPLEAHSEMVPEDEAEPVEARAEMVSEDQAATVRPEGHSSPERAEVNEITDEGIENDESHVRDFNNEETEQELRLVHLAYLDAAAAASVGALERLQHLIASWPVLVQMQDQNGWTLLHEAARNGHTQVVEHLLHAMLPLNVGNLQARTVQGQTALDLARDKLQGESQHPTILVLERALVSANHVEATEESQETLLSQNGDHTDTTALAPPHSLEVSLEPISDASNDAVSLDSPDDLHLAGNEERVDPIEQPMESVVTLKPSENDYSDEVEYGEGTKDGEDTEYVNDEEFPLDYVHNVIARGDVNALRSLLDSHPDLISNADPITGYSLLHVAAQYDHSIECLQLLLEYGSDVWYHAGASDLTPLDVAIGSFPDNNHHPIILLLQEAMGFRDMFGSLDDGDVPPIESDSPTEECEVDSSTGECRIEAHDPKPLIDIEVPPQKSSDEILAEALREFDEMQQQQQQRR
jgi:ankyrin repeat protein